MDMCGNEAEGGAGQSLIIDNDLGLPSVGKAGQLLWASVSQISGPCWFTS